MKNTEKKILKGIELDEDEARVWNETRSALLKQLDERSSFSSEVIPNKTKSAVACFIVAGKNMSLALCLLKSLLQSTLMNNTYRQLQRSARLVTSTESEEEGLVHFINLFEVPCNPPADESYCTQFVSSDCPIF